MNELLLRMNIDPYARLTRVYIEAIRQYKNKQHLSTFYDAAKTLLGLALVIYLSSQSFGCKLYQAWLIIIMSVSFLSFLVSKVMAEALNKLTRVVELGQVLDQVVLIDYEDEEAFEVIDETDLVVNPLLDPYIALSETDFRNKALWLAKQLKAEVLRQNKLLNVASQLTFYLNQLLIGFLIYLLAAQLTSCQEEKFWMVYLYMYAFLLISFCQYFEVYLILILAVLMLPFLIGYLVYLGYKMCKDRRQTRLFLNRFEDSAIKYTTDCVKGDQDCRICMASYNIGETVLVLPCSPLHHYHSQCALAWLRVSNNCPMCRKSFSVQEMEPAQQ